MIDSKDVAAFAEALRGLDDSVSLTERIEQLAALETIKSAVCAAQAQVSVGFEDQVRAERAARGVRSENRSKGVSTEIALACKQSPNRGSTLLGRARVLFDDMPCALELLRSGVLNEWRAMLIIKEIVCLDSADRQFIDKELCGDPATLVGLGDRAVSGKASKLAVERDQEAIVARIRKAPGERCVSSRPAPDSMAYLTSLLPMRDAVAVHATLSRDADSIMCTADVEMRSKSQVMADLLVQRCTGVSSTELLPVEVVVVISDAALLGAFEKTDDAGAEPGAVSRGGEYAEVQGYGPVPAAFVRELISKAVDVDAVVTLRKLYAKPGEGSVTALESSARIFPKGLARLIDLRDRWCRTPYCNARIRHHDHIVADHVGGETTANNGAGLCASCNYAKEADGWSAAVVSEPGQRHSFELVTPTGHRYRSTAPKTPAPLDIQRKAS